MAQANLPISYWGDALLTTAFILNRVPSTSVASTPYELWTKRKPDLSILRPWGSAAYIHDNSHKYGKLGPRGKKCIFIRLPGVQCLESKRPRIDEGNVASVEMGGQVETATAVLKQGSNELGPPTSKEDLRSRLDFEIVACVHKDECLAKIKGRYY
ncbi:zf-CCHC domain-containing protein/rve domain-containing protein/RVT_2 domain-containing protein/gag_pre-integrs domain-containing protein/UBN2_2 domain-containing protein [Senna tora]|uniref:Zf-CCHC domain-containing protein/rve domain-containing protein/RVT_2 domain-containing protein/gag_pre-integrs domain-containing protein/UBN2_2 domain-containing protein n=1 Tax=Senna tora TaxID=362788 RepID=A0A834WVW7_9FABA|nr:zf-CCHC domain-containing protein/rve domain-containing protein/RVT_2 domain-containing protein/gag_pre-integrs domain-containing protein/UBN2_2 domain-containing protein [Senna tora]